jgi:hypothetical protein
MPEQKSHNTALRTITHEGSEVGAANVTLSQNTASTESPAAAFTCPRKYDTLFVNGDAHTLRLIPRAVETFDGDGSQTTFALSGDIQPVAGEKDVDDQPYPVVQGADGTSALTVDSVDYAANEVTFTSAPSNGTDNVKVWYIVSEGHLRLRGTDRFDNTVGTMQTFPVPLSTFVGLNQNKKDNRPHLSGQLEWVTEEKVEYLIESPRQVVWTDSDYTDAGFGEFVSVLQQEVVASTMN